MSRSTATEGRFFHGYYGHYCYLPLYIFCEEFPLFFYGLSSGVKRANLLRLWFSTLAYLILVLVKKHALKNTPLANAEVLSIRLKLVKLAAKVTVSARGGYLFLAQGFPFQKLFATALKNATV